MKKISTLILFFLVTINMTAQSYKIFVAGSEEQRKNPIFGKGAIPREDGKILYKEVFSLEGKSQEEIYNRAVNSLGKLFPKYMVRITAQDEENYVLHGEGKFEFTYKRGKVLRFDYPYTVKFNICIECKEGRYRIIMDKFFLVNDEDGYVSDASNYNFSDEATLDKRGYVENSNNGCKRIGIITSYVYVSGIFREFMEQPIRKKVISDEW